MVGSDFHEIALHPPRKMFVVFFGVGSDFNKMGFFVIDRLRFRQNDLIVLRDQVPFQQNDFFVSDRLRFRQNDLFVNDRLRFPQNDLSLAIRSDFDRMTFFF